MPLLRVTSSGKCVCQKKWKIMRETSPVVCYCFARKVVSFNFSRWVKLAKFPPVRNSFVFARYKTRDTRQSCSRPSRRRRRRRRKSQNKKKSEKSDSLISCHRRATNTRTPGFVHNRKENKEIAVTSEKWDVWTAYVEPVAIASGRNIGSTDNQHDDGDETTTEAVPQRGVDCDRQRQVGRHVGGNGLERRSEQIPPDSVFVEENPQAGHLQAGRLQCGPGKCGQTETPVSAGELFVEFKKSYLNLLRN